MLVRYFASKEEYNKAVLVAIEETHKKNMESKESARKFLREIGVIEDIKVEPKAKSVKKKSK